MKPAKWQRILSAAGRAFARYGYRKTAMDDIARAAGVAKGTLYLGCRSKRDLFYQAILKDLHDWNAELVRLIDPRQPADELLVAVCQQAIDTRDRFPLGRDLILGVHDPDLPDWPEHIDELRGVFVSTALEIIRLGMRQGRFREDLDAEAVAHAILDLTSNLIMYHYRGPDPEARMQRHGNAVFDLVLRGLLT